MYCFTDNYIKVLQIKTADRETPIKQLSGGNQQKVILGRWLLTNPDFLILDEPTRGIDIGTKTEIQKLVLELAEKGMSVVFISSEVEEMLRTCSRMAVAAAVVCNILAGGQQSVTEYCNPYILGVLAGIAVAALCGCFNGFLVARLKIQPMIATLILFTAGRGIAQLITKGQITYVRVDHYKVLGSSIKGLPLPVPFFVALIVVILTMVILKRTALGMYIEAVGINSKASRLVGLKSSKIIFLTYLFGGIMAGIAGLVASSRIYSADANNIGLNMELDAILAVALGGNSLGGGKFSLMGSVIGAYTIQALTTTLYVMHVSSDQVPVYKAIVVVIIVSLQSPQLRKWINKAKLSKKAVSGNEVA